MEHLIAVLWEDYWRPWLANAWSWVKYISLGVIVLTCVAIGWIWLAIETEKLLR